MNARMSEPESRTSCLRLPHVLCRLVRVLPLALLASELIFARQSNAAGIKVTDVPVASSFRMPVAANIGDDLSLLTIASFANYSYPKIRFNENGNHKADANEWLVATAFNQNRWLNNGWDSEPSIGKKSEYNDTTADGDKLPDFHPGDDWNLNSGGVTDLGQPINAIADGVVLFSGCGYGNTIILVHRLPDGELITSYYGHMMAPSVFEVGQQTRKGDVIGYVGKTEGRYNKKIKAYVCRVYSASFPAHLHFEVRRQSMIQIDPQTSEIRLSYPATMWPAASQAENGDNGFAFIERNYYNPSEFLISAPAVFFEDNFDGTTLDPAKWNVSPICSDAVTVGGGVVQVGQPGMNWCLFPYVSSVGTVFPPTGDFRVEVALKYTSVEYLGEGLAVDGPNWTWGPWADTCCGGVRVNLGGRYDYVTVQPPDGWHRYALAVTGDTWTAFVDDAPVLTSSALPRPTDVWFGNYFANGIGFGVGTTFRIDYIKVTQ